MSSRLFQLFAKFHKHEDGLTTVELAVMLGLAVVGCVVAITLGGTDTNSPNKPSTFTVTFRDNWDRTCRVSKDTKSCNPRNAKDDRAKKSHELEVAATNDGASNVYLTDRKSAKEAEAQKQNSEGPYKLVGSKSGHTLTSTDTQADEIKTSTGDKAMSEDDLRQAIIGLLKDYPQAFLTSKERIQAAPIAHEAAYVQIELFRCSLQTRRFTYGPLPAGSGQTAVERSGYFYRDPDGAWTGKITSARK